MADKIRGITVELNGDTSGITKSLKTANTEIKSTQSQLKDVEKLLKLDPTNVELLRQKQKLLNDAVAESNTKLKTLKQAESELKNAGVDENSEQFMALKREIIATESAMQSYGTEAKKVNTSSTETTGKATSALATFKAGWIAVAAAVVAAGKAIKELTLGTASSADEILTLSTQTGITTDKIQELQYAAELVDVDLDTLSTSLTKNIRSMTSAKEGTGDAAEAYQTLGIAVTNADGSLRDSEEVYWELIDALGQVENETERDSLAMTLLGKSAQDLNPLIEAGSEKLAELAEEAHNTGYVMSEETLAAFGELDDSVQRLKNNATALGNSFAETLLPVMEGTVMAGSSLLEDLSQVIQESEGNLGEMLMGLVDKLIDYLPVICNTAIKLAWQIIDAVIDALPDLVPKLVDAICDVVEKIQSAEFIGKLITSALKLVWAVVKAVFTSLPRLLTSMFSWFNDGGYSDSETLPLMANGGTVTAGGAAIVGEAGPELLTNVGGQAVVTPLVSSGAATAVAAVSGGTINNAITIEFSGNLAQLGQLLQPYISAESHRIGV